MYQALNLNNNILAKRNHKELIVECVHPFLNKNIPIADEERGTNDIFVPTNIAVDYAQNSASIDDVYILHSIPTISREFHFHVNINLSVLTKMTRNNTQVTLEYLKITDSSRFLYFNILKILIKDFRTIHVDRIHNTRNFCCLETWRYFYGSNSPKQSLIK